MLSSIFSKINQVPATFATGSPATLTDCTERGGALVSGEVVLSRVATTSAAKNSLDITADAMATAVTMWNGQKHKALHICGGNTEGRETGGVAGSVSRKGTERYMLAV